MEKIRPTKALLIGIAIGLPMVSCGVPQIKTSAKLKPPTEQTTSPSAADADPQIKQPDEGITDEGITDEGITDEGITDEGTTDEGITDEGTTDEGITDEGITDEGTTDEGTTDEGITDGIQTSTPTPTGITVLKQGTVSLPNTNSRAQAGLGLSSTKIPDLVWKDLFIPTHVIRYSQEQKNFEMRADGYPAKLNNQYVEWPLLNNKKGVTLVVLYDGKGSLQPIGASASEKTQGREVWSVTSDDLILRLTETDPSNPLRNIRVVEKRFETNWQTDPFYPDFRRKAQNYKVIRLVVALFTSGSTVKTVAQLPKPGNATSLRTGIAIERLTEVCNEFMTDCWFTLPAMADDEYVRGFAKIVKANLDPRLRAYVEYSNETWNSAGVYAVAYYHGENEGAKYKCNAPDYNNNYKLGKCNTHHYTAKRSLEMWKIFDEVLGRDHVVHLMAGHAVHPWTYAQRLDAEIPVSFTSGLVTPRDYTDAISGTNYWGMSNKLASMIKEDKIDGSVEGWLKFVENNVDSANYGDTYSGQGKIDGFIDIARDLPIVQYEGGLAVTLPHDASAAIREKYPTDKNAFNVWDMNMKAACDSPKMYDITKKATSKFMNVSEKIHMFSQFTLAGHWTRYGCWALESPYSPRGDHRTRALNDWISENRLENSAPQIAVVREGNNLVAVVTDDGIKQIARIAVSFIGEGIAERGKVLSMDKLKEGVNKITVYANDGWAIGFTEFEVIR